MSDIRLTTETWYAGKKDWLASRDGLDVCRSITVDLALFDPLHAQNGIIPSGTVLGKVTATGFYGPYNDALTDGSNVAKGHLLNDIKFTAGDTHKVGAALYWRGIVKEANLPNFTGTANAKGEIDAAGKVDIGVLIRYE